MKRKKVSSLLKHNEFLYTVSWVFRDILRRYKLLMFFVAVLNLFALVFQVGSFVFAARAVVRLSQTGSFTSQRLNIDIPTENAFILAIIVGLGFFAAAVCRLGARILQSRLITKYENFCFRRGLKLISKNPFFEVPDLKKPTVSDYVRLVNRDSRMCSRVINELLGAMVPAMMMLVGSSFIVWAAPSLALSLAIPAVLIGFFYIKLSRVGAKVSVELDEAGKKDGEEKVNFIKKMISAGNYSLAYDEEIEKFYKREAPRKYHEIYEKRLNLPQWSNMIGSTTIAVVMGLLVLYFAEQKMDSSGMIIGRAVFYLLALRYAANGLMNLGKHYTNINIFFPLFKRYVHAVTGFNSARIRKFSDLKGNKWDMELNHHRMLHLERGKPRELFVDLALNRISLIYFWQSVSYRITDLDTDTRPRIGIATEYQDLSVYDQKFLEEYFQPVFLEALPIEESLKNDALEFVKNPNSYEPEQPLVKFLLSMAFCEYQETHIVLVLRGSLFKAGAELREAILARSKNRFLFFVQTNHEKMEEFPALALIEGELKLLEKDELATALNKDLVKPDSRAKRDQDEEEVEEDLL